MTDDEDPRNNDLPEVRSRIAQNEELYGSLVVQIVWNQALPYLLELPAWKQLVGRLQTVANGEQRKIIQQRMDEYELGKRQGKLAILNIVTQVEPLQRKALDDIEQAASLLREQIDSDRALLR